MWREVGCSAACGWPASFRIARVVDWATARWLVQAQVLSQQDDQYAQSKLVSEPLEYWIRAWDSGKPATSHSAACTRVFKGELTSQVRRPLHPNLAARPQDRYEYGKSRTGSEGSFKAENEVFLLR